MINAHLAELGFASPLSTCREGHPLKAEDAEGTENTEDAEGAEAAKASEVKCECLFHREPATSCADLLGASYVISCLSLLATADVVQTPNFLASALEGYRRMGPRDTKNREPDVVLYFNIPVHVARTSNAGECILSSTVPLGARQ